ncbi:MAG: YfcE family phosphodiesterase [Ruminococcaceae bacterium]|nr:YfcE family phosphodiesterase [Oscillospiraceae bacterium]
MRILVLSDSHGDYFTMKKIIKAQPNAEVVIFLGDGHYDFERCKPLLDDKRIYAVKGNNDFHCDYPKNAIICEGGIKIYITHGHYEYVKSSFGRLITVAKENSCTLALYGHRHEQREENCDGVKLFSPGAVKNDEYGVIDIVDGGYICIGIKIK